MILTGKFESKRPPFGLIGAPFTFAQAMTHVLQGMEEVLANYYDDILLFSPLLDAHSHHLELLMKNLANTGYQLNIQNTSLPNLKLQNSVK